MSLNSSKKSKSDLFRLAVTLFAITFTVALILSVVNFFTSSKIAAIKQEKLESAMARVITGGKSFTDETDKISAEWDDSTPLISIQSAKNDAGEIVGYCVEVTPKGYSDVIDMMVGLNADGEIVGTDIISISDTPGIGTQVQSDPLFAKQFEGKAGKVVGVKGGASGNEEIDLISGATYSSTGFTNGINAALRAYRLLTGEAKA